MMIPLFFSDCPEREKQPCPPIQTESSLEMMNMVGPRQIPYSILKGAVMPRSSTFSKENEPEIYGAIKKGAILENVVMDANGVVDFEDTSITQNTRVSYPIHHIENIQAPSVGSNVKNIFFLTADAFGVIPPISKVDPLTGGLSFYFWLYGQSRRNRGRGKGTAAFIFSMFWSTVYAVAPHGLCRDVEQEDERIPAWMFG